ncbi:Soyasaponin III rhamnosyltransferase [Bertholletia excelsa]
MHVAMFPWLAFGHIIPYLDLAKFIARKGHRVSFISTPRNIERLPNLPPNLSPLIDFVKLTLPRISELPVGAEATMDVRVEDVHYLKKALDGLEIQLANFLEASKPDWIIYDFAQHWVPTIAGKLGVSRAFFLIINAWFASFFGPASAMTDRSRPLISDPEQLTTQPEWINFPTNLAFRLHESKRLVNFLKHNLSEASDFFRGGSAIVGCDVFLIRHCREFEPQWLTLVEELHQKPVIPVGLMPPSVEDSVSDQQNQTWVTISEWLNKRRKGSVVFIALGSEVTLTQNELTELALGLELSGLPFFWALRKPPGSAELPEGFEERASKQGLVWTSWAPQPRILSHESTGGFLTHCGWGSIVEALGQGLPLIMLPFLIDQGLNARVLEEKQVGVEVSRDEEGNYSRHSVAESVRRVMVDSNGRIYRDKAREMSAVFGDKVVQGRYLDHLIQYLESHHPAHKE